MMFLHAIFDLGKRRESWLCRRECDREVENEGQQEQR